MRDPYRDLSDRELLRAATHHYEWHFTDESLRPSRMTATAVGFVVGFGSGVLAMLMRVL